MSDTMTILEAARALDCTKGAIRYHLKKLPAEAVSRDQDGVLQLSLQGVEQLRQIMGRPADEDQTKTRPLPDNDRTNTSRSPDKDQTETGSLPVNDQTGSSPSPDSSPDKPDKDPDNSPDNAIIARLLDQLTAKDSQIAARDAQIAQMQQHEAALTDQIGALTEALQAAQTLAAAAQQLHAGTMRQVLQPGSDDQIPAEDPAQDADRPEQQPRPWWKFWSR